MALAPISHLSLLFLPLLVTISIMLPSYSYQIQDPRLVDRIIRDSAFLSYPNHHKTAILYGVKLPPTLRGVTADIARFRSGSLRRHGAAIKEFRFAPGVTVHPHMTRLVVICQNLGSQYSSIYNISGFRLDAPVLGLLVYDAANLGRNHSAYPSELDVFVKKQPIAVNFSSVVHAVSEGRRKLMCATFLLDGKVSLSRPTESDMCVAWRQGHFGLVVESLSSSVREREEDSRKMKVGRWKLVMTMAVGGAFVAVLLGLVAVAVVKVKRRRSWIAEMERRAYEEEALQMSMVGHVRAPTATSARTTPAMENDYYPCL